MKNFFFCMFDWKFPQKNIVGVSDVCIQFNSLFNAMFYALIKKKRRGKNLWKDVVNAKGGDVSKLIEGEERLMNYFGLRKNKTYLCVCVCVRVFTYLSVVVWLILFGYFFLFIFFQYNILLNFSLFFFVLLRFRNSRAQHSVFFVLFCFVVFFFIEIFVYFFPRFNFSPLFCSVVVFFAWFSFFPAKQKKNLKLNKQ